MRSNFCNSVFITKIKGSRYSSEYLLLAAFNAVTSRLTSVKLTFVPVLYYKNILTLDIALNCSSNSAELKECVVSTKIRDIYCFNIYNL